MSLASRFTSKEFVQENLLVGDCVPESLKLKIQADEFIDFVDLLSIDEKEACP